MDRRGFLRLDTKPSARRPRRSEKWLRPPFVRDEIEFLLACTRCDACIEACPHGVLFKLPSGFGAQVAGGPAMDLLNRGCHLCEDWPCVSACEPGALSLPAEPEAAPRLAQVSVDPDLCLAHLGPECGACAHACPVPGALTWENGVRPAIDADHCTGCALCREACIVEPKAIKVSAFLGGEGRGTES